MDDLINEYTSYKYSSEQLDNLLEASGHNDLPNIFVQNNEEKHVIHHDVDAVYLEELSILKAYLDGLTVSFGRMHDQLKSKLSQMDLNEITRDENINRQTMRSDFFVIAAACYNNGIGFKNKLPWRLKNELEYFNRMTTKNNETNLKNVVIMGRKTWSSIPPKYRPLKDRTNVVLSHTVSTIEDRDSVDHIFTSLPAALEGVSQLRNKGNVWIVGGQSIYEEALKLPQCKRIYLTRIHAQFECDTFFPEIDPTIYKETKCPDVPGEEQEEDGVRYNFTVYDRIDNIAA